MIQPLFLCPYWNDHDFLSVGVVPASIIRLKNSWSTHCWIQNFQMWCFQVLLLSPIWFDCFLDDSGIDRRKCSNGGSACGIRGWANSSIQICSKYSCHLVVAVCRSGSKAPFLLLTQNVVSVAVCFWQVVTVLSQHPLMDCSGNNDSFLPTGIPVNIPIDQCFIDERLMVEAFPLNHLHLCIVIPKPRISVDELAFLAGWGTMVS